MMYNFPIGVMAESFGLDTKSAVLKAKELGANGLQMYCARGHNAPENLTKDKRKELLDFVKSNGLQFSAICGDMGRGFHNREQNAELIQRSKEIMELAKELESDIVTTHIGVIPSDPHHDRYKIMQEACFELAEFADSMGSHFAIETGPETSLTLKGFLDGLGTKGVAVNLDPANLVMVAGDDPVLAVYNLKDYIVHTHAKDGIKKFHCDPELVYGIRQPMGEEEISKGAFEEMPLGEGKVDFPAYIKALDDIGYKGFLTIERKCGDNPSEDIKSAMTFLKSIISN